jgi:CRP-like cAMP-binding protein
MPPSAHKELTELLPPGLIAECSCVNLAKGALLFSAGKIPVYMFFVVSGELVLERPGLHGAPVILQRTRHGFVSEASLQSSRYHCDGRAVSPSEIARIPIKSLRAALDCDSAFAIRWIGMLNREVKRLRLQCERLSLNKVQDRLVHLLETEGKTGQYPLGSGLKSLAGELGVTHEALYRCVSDMEKNNLLSRDQGNLRLLRDESFKFPLSLE